jgi:hypothetical protein
MLIDAPSFPTYGAAIAVPLLIAAWLTRNRGWVCERCAWKRIATERRERRKGTTIYIDF